MRRYRCWLTLCLSGGFGIVGERFVAVADDAEIDGVDEVTITVEDGNEYPVEGITVEVVSDYIDSPNRHSVTDEHGRASGCPSSVSPHAIRTGSITALRDSGTPREVVSDRGDVTEKILEKHYDKASKRQRMRRRKDHVPEDF